MAKDYALRFVVNTTPDLLNDTIHQEVFSEFNGIRQLLLRQVVDTEEAQFREALIRLGWTPPKAV